MDLIVLDVETYYTNTDLGFKTQTTEEYVRDQRFEVIGISVQVNAGKPEWFSGTMRETKEWLEQFDWGNSMAVAHNALFDMAILNWHFGIKPKGYLDTLCMARAIHGVEAGGSLKALAERYQIGQKGTEVNDALGKRRVDFSEEDLHQYGAYCRNDVALTKKLFDILMERFPMKELKVKFRKRKAA